MSQETEPNDQNSQQNAIPENWQGIQDFLQEKMGNRPCEACGGEKWTVFGFPPEGRVPAIMLRALKAETLDPERDDPVSRLRCFHLACDSCGLLRFHYLKPFEDWKTERLLDSNAQASKGNDQEPEYEP